MLIDFRVSNYRSFNEAQVLSMVASKDRHLADNIARRDEFALLKAAAIYGANASGKSNMIRGLRLLRSLVVNSASKMTLGDEIVGASPFRLINPVSESPCSFVITILIGSTRCEYGVSFSLNRVHEEWLNVYEPGKERRQRWFERKLDPKSLTSIWTFRGPLQKEEDLLKKTRENCLLLSYAAQNIKNELLDNIFLWFRNKVLIFDVSTGPLPLMMATAKLIKENNSLKHKIEELLNSADFGINRLSVTEKPFKIDEFPKEMKDLFSENGLRSMASKVEIKTEHDTGSNEKILFDMEDDESQGTQRFFSLAGPMLDAFATGKVLVLDELGSSMHPNLSRKMIELFHSPVMNTENAQVLFTTHDSTLMDPTLFRRDQIWLIERNRIGASQLHSLFDFASDDRPRSTEAFQRNYLAGRYGGVPQFGPALEDLDRK